MRVLFTAIAAVCACTGAAQAQNTQLLAQTEVISTVTIDEMSELFQAAGFTPEQKPAIGGSPVLQVTSDGGAAFYVAFRNCAGAACDVLDVFGYVKSAGLSYDEINTLHGENIVGSVIILNDDGPTIVNKKMFLQGGISHENLGFQFGVFFQDITMVASLANSEVMVSIEPSGDAGNMAIAKAAGGFGGAALVMIDNPIINETLALAPMFTADYIAAFMNQLR